MMSRAKALKVKLKPGLSLGIFENIKPEPWWASNFYSIKSPIFCALLKKLNLNWLIEPNSFSKCKACLLSKNPKLWTLVKPKLSLVSVPSLSGMHFPIIRQNDGLSCQKLWWGRNITIITLKYFLHPISLIPI